MDVWAHVGRIVGWLDEKNGRGGHEKAMRLLKVSEEAGEAAQAYIGLQGQNPRKGTSHTETDVADELCDVILSAMVALGSFTEFPEAHFAAVVRHRSERLRQRTEGA